MTTTRSDILSAVLQPTLAPRPEGTRHPPPFGSGRPDSDRDLVAQEAPRGTPELGREDQPRPLIPDLN